MSTKNELRVLLLKQRRELQHELRQTEKMLELMGEDVSSAQITRKRLPKPERVQEKMRVLRLVEKKPGLGVSEIGRQIDRFPGTVWSWLKEMVEDGEIIRDGDKYFAPNGKAMKIRPGEGVID